MKSADNNPPWIVAIGASGDAGLKDIKAVLQPFPATLNAIVLVVLHRPWRAVTNLRAVLARITNLPVVIATEAERMEAGTIYIGEPAHHLTLAAKNFGHIVHDLERRYRNRTVDILFNSIALHAGGHSIGVVLSGSLDDGSRGLAAIGHAGGKVMVRTPHTRTQGMPENAIRYDGPIDFVGSPGDIARAIWDVIRVKPMSR